MDTADWAGPDMYPLTATERRLRGAQQSTYYSGDSPLHQKGVVPPSTASIVWAPELRKRSLSVSLAPPLAMFVSDLGKRRDHVPAATGYHRRLSRRNPFKTRVSLVELGRISRRFYGAFRKSPNKNVPQV